MIENYCIQWIASYLLSHQGKTVIDNINLGVKKSQDLLDRFTELSLKCSEPLSDAEMADVMNELEDTQNKIDVIQKYASQLKSARYSFFLFL